MSVIAKDFSPLVQALRQKVGRTSFSFRFEDLFTKEEWLLHEWITFQIFECLFLVKMAISSNCIIKSINITK